MEAEFEGEVLRGGQGGAGADEPLRRGFVGAVDEDDRAFEGGSLGEARADEGRLPLGHADRGEDHDEAVIRTGDAGGVGDPGREFEAGQAVSGEDRQLLAADQGVQSVDRRDTGFDEFGRVGACDRVDGVPVEVTLRRRQNRGSAVDGPSHAVENPAHEVAPDRQLRGAGPGPHGRRGDVEPAGAAEDLDHHPVARDLEDLATSQLTGGCHDVDELVVGDPSAWSATSSGPET